MARHGREGVEESYCTREERRALEAGKCLCVAGGCAGHVPCEQVPLCSRLVEASGGRQGVEGGDTTLECSGVDAVQ